MQTLMRSALFVPGDRPERFDKAIASGADAVIVDFEDAVEEANKVEARHALARYLDDHPGPQVWVRSNSAGHAQYASDLAFCAAHPGVIGIVVPKAQAPAELPADGAKPLLLIVESAIGLQHLPGLAAHPGVARLTFGGLDLAVDLGMEPGTASCERLFDTVRIQLRVQSTLNSLLAPLETVFAALNDPDGLHQRASDARHTGFAGMLCIHPAQVAVVNAAFLPTADQATWAAAVIEQARSQPGAFRFQGQMVDAPVLARAQRLLDTVHAAHLQERTHA